ncbi:MAG: aldo/keto reductase [Pseudomonadota bacterium]
MIDLPALGLGCAPIGGLLAEVSDRDAQAVFAAAEAARISYYDTAPFYGFGLSERRTGDALRHKTDAIVSSKVGRILKPGAWDTPADYGWPAALPFHHVYDYSYDGVMRSYEDSLQRLGRNRIDILYLHDIGSFTHHDPETEERHFKDAMSGGYRALEELRASGDVSGIGIGVNEVDVSMRALEHGAWDVFLLAGRYTLLEQEPLQSLFPACDKSGTSIVVGGPYNSGILVGGETWNYAQAPEHIRDRVGRIKTVCERHAVPMPAAAIQFCQAHPTVACVIAGARTGSEFTDTVNWSRTNIPNDLWAELKAEGLLDAAAPTPASAP